MPNETAYAVILVLRLQQALAAAGLPVQFVALDVGEHAPVQVDLVQVARAVVHEVEPTAIGQCGVHTCAQSVVAVFYALGGLTGFGQARLRGLLGYQLAVCRVGFLGNEIADNTAREPPHNLTSS